MQEFMQQEIEKQQRIEWISKINKLLEGRTSDQINKTNSIFSILRDRAIKRAAEGTRDKQYNEERTAERTRDNQHKLDLTVQNWLETQASLQDLMNGFHHASSIVDPQNTSIGSTAGPLLQQTKKMYSLGPMEMLAQVFKPNKHGFIGGLMNLFSWLRSVLDPKQPLREKEVDALKKIKLREIFNDAEKRGNSLNELFRAYPQRFSTEQMGVSTILQHIKFHLTKKEQAKEAHELLKDAEIKILGGRLSEEIAPKIAERVTENLQNAIKMHKIKTSADGLEAQSEKIHTMASIVKKLVQHIVRQEEKINSLKTKQDKYELYLLVRENKRKLLAFINKTDALAQGLATSTCSNKQFIQQLDKLLAKVECGEGDRAKQLFGPNRRGLFRLYTQDTQDLTTDINSDSFNEDRLEIAAKVDKEIENIETQEKAAKTQQIQAKIQEIKQIIARVELSLRRGQAQKQQFEIGGAAVQSTPGYQHLLAQEASEQGLKQFLSTELKKVEKNLQDPSGVPGNQIDQKLSNIDNAAHNLLQEAIRGVNADLQTSFQPQRRRLAV